MIVKMQRETDDLVVVSRFQREAAVMLRLRHPGIVALYAAYDADLASGRPASLVMEYIAGPTLAVLVADHGSLAVERTASILEQIAAALDCAHAGGVIHRDIKPSNLLLPARGSAKLTDFGVARIDDDQPLTVMGDILGTIEYASPEQVHGKEAADARSDVYSLAAVSYFALTGTPPFRAADSSTQAQLSVMHRQVFSSPPPLRLHRADLPAAVEDVVLRGLAKTPESRYDSAGQLAAAFRSAALVSASEGKAAAPEIAADAAARRVGALAGAAAGAVLLLAGFGVWKLTPFRTPTAALPPATVPASSAPPPTMPVVIAKTPAPAKPAPLKVAARSSVKSAAAAPPQKPVQTAQAAKPRPVRPAFLPAKPKRRVQVAALPRPVAALPRPARRQPKPRQTAVLLAVKPRPAVEPTAPKTPLVAARLPLVPILAAVPAASAAAAAPLPGASGWYSVTGWTAVADSAPPAKPQPVRATALWVTVDDQPFPALALGQWASLPAGKHLVTFQPADGLGAGPLTWAIDIVPAAHLSQNIPLPAAPLPLIPPHLRNP